MSLLYAHIGSLNSALIALHWICCLPTSSSWLQAFYGKGHLCWMLFYLYQHNIKAKINICVCARVCVCVRACAQLLGRVGLCHLKDCNPPGSSVHAILQARTLEWVAMLSSRGSSWSMDLHNPCHLHLLHWLVNSLPLSYLGGSKYLCTKCWNEWMISDIPMYKNGNTILYCPLLLNPTTNA